MPLAAAFPGVAHVAVCQLLHKSVITLSIIIQLLARPNSDVLSKLMALEAPTGSNPPLWTLTEHLAGRDCPAVHLLGLLGNCSSTFRKVAHLTAAAMSLIVCRRPAVALSVMDGGALANALHLYLKGISHLVCNAECIVEERYGVLALNTVLPLLYQLSDWSDSSDFLLQSGLPTRLAMLMINILHSASGDYDRAHLLGDHPPDLEQLPELHGATQFAIAPLLLEEGGGEASSWRLELLQSRPMSFAVACSI
jgi:hypothetical protein